MICKSCGINNPDWSLFCSMCGTPSEVEKIPESNTCHSCGCVNDEDAVFCKICGSKLIDAIVKPMICPECNTLNSVVANYCSACGFDFLAEPVPEVEEEIAEEVVPVVEEAPVEDIPEVEPEVGPVVEEPEEVAEAEVEPVVEAEPEPVVEAEPEPVVEAEPEPVVEAEPEAEPVPDSVTCPACGEVLPIGSKFCSVCGSKVQVQEEPAPVMVQVAICPSCQSENPAGSRFCAVCGYNMSAPDPMAVEPEPVAPVFVEPAAAFASDDVEDEATEMLPETMAALAPVPAPPRPSSPFPQLADVVCKICFTTNEHGSMFCGGCGNKLG